MGRKRSVKRINLPLSMLLLLLISILLAASPRASAEVTGFFKGVSFWAKIGEGGKRIYSVSGGSGTLKNEKEEIVAEGKLEDKEGYIAIRSRKGGSFEYKPQTTKVTSTKCTETEPSQFATMSLDKQNRWLLTDSNFFFLMKAGGTFSPTIQILFPESIVRASVITLPSGKFELFGYRIKVPKDGARVKFFHGIVVENSNCTVADIK